MELLFDTANIDDIKKYMEYYPITGITSNPTILKAEGKIEFFNHLKEIRKVIGFDKTLHVQVIGTIADEMIKEAYAIINNVDKEVFIKIPTTQDGLKTIMKLKSEGIGVTATAIYTTFQGFSAIMAGADFIAPYCNRMLNLDVDFEDAIRSFRKVIDDNKSNCKILAASFKNITQVNKAYIAGAQTATVQPALLRNTFNMATVEKAVYDFKNDWTLIHGDKLITDL
ncbi:fructose-bisphosphate aldolase [Candidatus Epulonipiscium fishelsonii]|uniref:Fructose-bisphosphate aldolase n=1 Tax=Candidatus Epulonipiscium fishelsonii TaxID=77094 RepID=A0ACC8XFY1_9FIRM|nr:fructose-bisphosphate aldolase [Epulopiscium sp. SCG-B05WGA-EpuloA1]ONI42108.1 fructose-bisphosphate aldolase [Epulopiscium sp. SCG-B11WGA-EpuloA1]